MATEVTLDARSRSNADLGSPGSRRLRRSGFVPATVYGHGIAPVSAAVEEHALFRALRTDAGSNVLLTLRFDDGNEELVMPRDVVRHSVKDNYVHLDFLRVSLTEKVTVDVGVVLVGDPIGVREEGGIVEQQTTAVQVAALANAVPDQIEVNVEDLNIGDSATVADLIVPDDVEVLTDPDTTVASIVLVAEEVEAEPEAEEAVEGEVPAAEEEGGEAAEAEGE